MNPRPSSHPVPPELSLRRFLRHLRRGTMRRCPNCGSGGLFRRWLVMRPSCPRCHLKLDRGESDYFLGSFTVNFVAMELLICALAFGAMVLTWPDVPWDRIKWGLILTVIPAPAITLPFARTVWLAIDLTFRPLTPADLEGHGENLPPDETPAGEQPVFPQGLGRPSS